MSHRLLLTGSEFSALDSEVFAELADDVGTQPESILYLTPKDHPRDATEDRWSEFGPSAALRLDTLDGIVSDWYEQDQYKGPVTNIDQPLLSRLAELGVEGIDSPTNPLYTGDRFPSSGVVQEARALFTELEFAGLLSADAMRTRLDDEDLSNHATNVGELADAIETARTETLAETLRETYRSERMAHVTAADTPPRDVFPSVEAIVLSGFTQFTVLEAELIERLADQWPIVALLPIQNDVDSAIGIDTGVAPALETYHDLGFSRRYHDETPSDSTRARRRITRSLYRHPERSPDTNDINATDLALTFAEPDTVPAEIRHTARDIRTELAAGADPSDIGVVLTSPVQYADQLRETFEAYEIPFSLQTDVPLPKTAIGELTEAICQLSREPRTLDSLLAVLTNPLVEVTGDEGSLEHRRLTRVAVRVDSTRLDSILERVAEDIAVTIDSLIQDIADLADEDLDTLPEALDTLFDRLGVTDALSEDGDLPRRLEAREASAKDSLDRVLETLALTAPMADLTRGNCLDRLERALHDVSIQRTGRPTDDNVVVCSLAEAVPRDFEQTYVLGLTSAHFPSNTDKTAFSQPIYDAHPDFEQTDVTAEARYHFGVLLGSDTTLHLSAPQRSLSGEPYVEADVLTELRRLVDLSAVTVDPGESEPGYQEDVQWTVGDALADTTEERAQELVSQAVDVNTFDSAQQVRIDAGVACAAARAGPELTPYDGQLTEETVASIHDQLDREPYSPSRLETYAACGFKYYMRRALGIKSADPFTREPDAGARGSYVHDVLEQYYRSLQTREGEPVHPGRNFERRQARLLEVALDRLTENFDDHSLTAFQQEWLTKVLAGLGTPETNPYYAPTAVQDGPAIARGLFYRFLEHEFDEPAKATARPTWFEGRIGNPYDAGTPLGDDPAYVETPQGTIPIHGLIDRIETVPGTDPTQIVVRDYKTGSTIPSENDALSGLKFQLQLYALMAEDALENVEVVGGAYYQVSPPSSANSRKGLLTSQEMASYYDHDDIETPLLRARYPHFETHEAFRRFVDETTADRLGDLAAGITEGSFQPTVLDPSDAGCRYCDYAHVCDVRPHQRRDTIEAIDENDVTTYIPLRARGQGPEDVLEVE